MFAASLLGLTLMLAVVSFVVGVLSAYFLWGIEYFRVVEAETSTQLLKQQIKKLDQDAQQMNDQLLKFQ